MKVRFKSIAINDFKGVKSLTTDFGKKSTQILGANESGKTTFADAISYALTGKNSLGESNFEILPIDTKGLSPKVELEIGLVLFDRETPVTLTREYHAKYNKQKEFTGEYATVCYINGIKTGVKDFDKWIAEHICSPEIFRLIHDVKYFTENISTNGKERPWEAQRRLLMSLVDTDADLDIARSNAKYEPLVKYFERYDNATQLSQAAKTKLREVENEIGQLGTELNTLTQQSNIGIEEADIEAIKEEIAALELEKADLEDKLRMNEHEDRTIQELKDKRYELMQQQAEQQAIVDVLIKERCAQASELESRRNAESAINKSIEDDQKQISIFNEQIAKSGICAHCGNELSEEQKAKIIADLEARKSELESDIVEKSSMLGEIQRLINESEQRRQKSYDKYCLADDDLVTIGNELVDVNTQIAAYEASKHEDKYTEPLKEVNTRIAQLSCKLAEANKSDEIAKYISSQITAKREQFNATLDKKAKLAQINDLCNDFIADKCKSIQGNINSLFDGIHFSLFRMNKTNEEIKECCDITYFGVPYQSLSYSTKFIVSMQIALAFQSFYKVEMPLIVDNAESINFSDELPVQTIRLIKAEPQCPNCGSQNISRKNSDGKWKCKDCGRIYTETLEITKND